METKTITHIADGLENLKDVVVEKGLVVVELLNVGKKVLGFLDEDEEINVYRLHEDDDVTGWVKGSKYKVTFDKVSESLVFEPIAIKTGKTVRRRRSGCAVQPVSMDGRKN